jgi:CO/xanthine dehydrogenase Mo-binding subunit
MAEVEVLTQTGKVHTEDDRGCGRGTVINPRVVEGQIEGA